MLGRIWCVVGLVACGDSHPAVIDAPHVVDAPHVDAPLVDGKPADAAGPNLSCSGQAIPTTAPDPVILSGFTDQITGIGLLPEAGVKLDAYVNGDVTPRASVVSDAQGAFTFGVPSGGTANAGYLLATKTGLVPTYLYAATAVYMNLPNSIDAIVSAQTLGTLENAAGVTQDPGNGLISVQIIDCAGTPIAGAHLTSPSGAVFYTSQGAPSAAATATDGSGVIYIFNVPVGPVTVAATLGTTTLRSNVIGSFAGSPTFALLQP